MNEKPLTPLQVGIGAVLLIGAAAFILGPMIFGIAGV
jgi:hypothetical protein